MKKILLILILLILPGICFGQNLIINEIAWMGNEKSHYNEWIEFFNNSSSTLDITGYKIEEGLDIKLKGKIKPKGFFLLERTDDKSVKNIKADQIYKGGLKNDGEDLILKNNKGEVIEKLQYLSGWPQGKNKNKKTMERIQPFNKQKWQTSKNKGGTPKSKNSEGEPKKEFPISADLNKKLPSNINKTASIIIGLFLAIFSSVFVVILKKRL